jgi:dihydroxyacetone kinase-like protein
MSTKDVIPFETFRKALLQASDRICGARDELCALDAAAGDGDLGATLATGFTAVREFLSGWDEPDSGATLMQIGAHLGRTAPSTIGALLASAFMRGGREVLGLSELRSTDIAAMLSAATDAVTERGQATVGQRTVLDAMKPAAVAAERACRTGAGAAETLRQAAAAATTGAKATAEMDPVHGRAGWIGERARGRPDAGATAWATYVTGLAEAL